MLVFTKLIILSAIILLVIGAIVYTFGYSMSGTTSLKYYRSTNQTSNSTIASSNFVQNGLITLKVFGLAMLVIGLVFILCAAVNEKFKLSQSFHHLKYSKPLH